MKDNKRDENITKSLFRELPYSGTNIISTHGQFNNTLMSNSLPTKKYLDKLSSIYDTDLFSLNTTLDSGINPDANAHIQHIRSQYHSPHSFSQLKTSLPNKVTDFSFSIFHNNIRSLKRNHENLQTQLLNELDFHFSVIGVSETRITNANCFDDSCKIPGYEFEYVPTPLAAGGVGMYIDKSLNYTVIEKRSDEAFQALWIEFHFLTKTNIVCGIMYRQHNSPDRFLTYFADTLEKLAATGKAVYIMGDFNIDLLKTDKCNYSHNFLLTLQSCSFIPTIDKPSRVHGSSATLIDNILVNNLTQPVLSGNIVSDISDHFSQFCILYSAKDRPKPHKIKFRDYSRFSESKFYREVSDIDWNLIFANKHNNVNQLFTSFYTKINNLVNKHAPLKTLSLRKSKQFSKPWITKGIRTSIKIKNKLFYTGEKHKYKYYRNKITNLIRLSKKVYFHSYFQNNLNNMKKTWQGINNIIHRKRTAKPVTSLKKKHESRLTHDPLELSNILNNHFASIGNKLASEIHHTENHFTDYLGGSQRDSFFFKPVNSTEIRNEISAIPNGKSHGLYSCPTRILKCSKEIISYPLAKIMNASIEQGIYPAKLKLAKIIPVHKADDETDPNNYRPISLLSTFNRIFEKLMYNRLKSFIEKNSILYKSQYGFRERHSTQHAIIDIVNKIQSNMELKMFSCGIFIDLKKAFDTVDHTILLNKLHHYGIRGTSNDWFASYLRDRSQLTLIGDIASQKERVSHGVPQGSVLGPLLFLIYINDIHNSSDKFDFFLFADDTNLLYADKNLKSLECIVNRELKKVNEWLAANKLTLNAKKSNFVVFHPRQKKLTYHPNIKLFDHISNRYISLEFKEHVKYLGVLIDSTLSWKFHVDYVATKISRTVGLIARLRYFLPLPILINLYRSLIYPYLSYGISVWGQAAQVHTNKLVVLQKRALRLMHFADRREHAIPMFISSNILPLEMLYFKSIANLMHDVSTQSVPINISELFTKSKHVHSYNTRSSVDDKLYVKHSRLELQKRFITTLGTRVWNNLPTDLRNSRKPVFKNQIHQMLINMLKDENVYVDLPMIINRSAGYFK